MCPDGSTAVMERHNDQSSDAEDDDPNRAGYVDELLERYRHTEGRRIVGPRASRARPRGRAAPRAAELRRHAVSDTTAASAIWESLAAELAANVAAWRTLLDEHTPTATGHCHACTTGGAGMRVTPWPCGPQRLAERARDIHAGDRAARRGHLTVREGRSAYGAGG
jgi:hypothetical protein